MHPVLSLLKWLFSAKSFKKIGHKIVAFIDKKIEKFKNMGGAANLMMCKCCEFDPVFDLDKKT